MNMYKIAEYEALRATIRERGTVRMCLVLTGLIAWGALLLALNAFEFDRAVALVPLTVLAATFEVSFVIHTGVERVGRYLQAFYEEDEPALSEPRSGESKGWETAIMAHGRKYPGGGPDPLFTMLFAVAAFINFAASLTPAHPGWIGISFVGHVAVSWRLITARRLSAVQRALDLDRFRALKAPPASN